MRRAMRNEAVKSVRDEFFATLQHRSEATGKYHKRPTREAMESMRDWYEDEISALGEGNGKEMQRLREGMEEAKSKAEKEKAEAEMTTMAADVNEALKGEDPLVSRGCDRKEDKEPAPTTVNWGGRAIISSVAAGQEKTHKGDIK